MAETCFHIARIVETKFHQLADSCLCGGRRKEAMNASHSGAISAEHLEMEMRAARLFRSLAIDTSRNGQVVFGMLNHRDSPDLIL
jgi:hypothetical protein